MGATTSPALTGRVPVWWHEQAACQYEKPEQIRPETDPLYHPAGERGEDRKRRAEEAKKVCAGCPVRQLCRDDARARREAYGVWGGESEDERAAWLAGVRQEKKQRVAVLDGDAQPDPPPTRKLADRTPCLRCGRTMRTRRPGRSKLADIADGEVFHRAHGECQTCYQATRRRSFTARWEITDLGADMTLAQLIAEACNGRVQEAAQAQRVRLECQPHELAFRIDSAADQLVATGRARALEREVAAA